MTPRLCQVPQKNTPSKTVDMQKTKKVLPFSQADRRMRGRLCGICGDYDGDTVKEFRKPQDNQALTSQEYASSYAVMNSECTNRQTGY